MLIMLFTVFFQVAVKMVIFLGFALGTFGAGVISDMYGRKPAILVFTQLLLGSTILSTFMPEVISFSVVYFFG